MPMERLARLALVAAVALSSIAGVSGMVRWATATGEADLEVGPDFAMFYTAASLARADRWPDVYAIEPFSDTFSTVYGETGSSASAASFAYPPPLAQALAPLARVTVEAAFIVWFAVSVAATAAAVAIQSRSRRAFLVVAPVALTSVPAYVMLRLGQVSWLALLLVALALWLLHRDRHWEAGAVLGLLVFKPHLLLGIGLWLLLGQRTGRVFRGAAVSVTAILTVSLILDPGAWRSWLGNLAENASPPGVRSVWDYSAPGWLREIGRPAWGWFVAALLVAAGAAAGIGLIRKTREHPATGLAVGLALSVALAPRALAYDWILLMVPMVEVARCERLTRSTRYLLSAAVLLASTAGYWPVSFGTRSAPIAVFVLVGVLLVASAALPMPQPMGHSCAEALPG